VLFRIFKFSKFQIAQPGGVLSIKVLQSVEKCYKVLQSAKKCDKETETLEPPRRTDFQIFTEPELTEFHFVSKFHNQNFQVRMLEFCIRVEPNQSDIF
jgi:hypothetical protein